MGTIADVESYLSAFSNGVHESEARELVQKLKTQETARQDHAAWAKAQKARTIAEVTSYQSSFTNGLHLAEASTLLKQLVDEAETSHKPQAGKPWTNTLGMAFAPVPLSNVLFCIWETRVQDYEAFMRATNRAQFTTNQNWEKAYFTQGPTHPAVNVSWDDAQAFCRWLTAHERGAGRLGTNQSYRLPTDAEWSVAVGLPKESGSTPQDKDMKIAAVYPWGTTWPPPKGAGNYADETTGKKYGKSFRIIAGYDDGFAQTAPVGSFKPNQFGLCDLAGNAWEWCEDFYDGKSGDRVLRGASWFLSDRGNLWSSRRSNGVPAYRSDHIGFRCVLGVSSAP